MKTIKQIVSERLTEKGISPKKMCEEIGISEQALYQIYRKNTASTTTLNKINSYLDLKLNKMFSVNDVDNVESSDVNKDKVLLDFFRQENEFLKGFIKEKLAINFNTGVLKQAVLGVY